MEKIAANEINAAIAAYMVGMLALGFTGARKLHQGEYHLAGRSLNLLLLTGTFCATVVGASATVDMARLGFSKGLPGAWWIHSGTAGLMALSIRLTGRRRATGCSTLPEIAGSFYGERFKNVASALVDVS